MAQFYAEIQGNRGLASRMGTEKSGIWGHIRGWDVGVIVDVTHVTPDSGKPGFDVVAIRLSSGSNGSNSKLLGTYRAEDLD